MRWFEKILLAVLAAGAAVLAAGGGTGEADAPPVCPTAAEYEFSQADPAGDLTLAGINNRDILLVAAAGDSQTLCVTVTFDVPVDPQLTSDYFGVSIAFDIDENAATGIPFGAFYFDPPYPPVLRCGAPGAIGAERVFDLPSGQLHEMPVDPEFPWLDQPLSVTPVPVLYDGNSFTTVIPLASIGGDSSFQFEVMARDHAAADYSYADDCAPNEFSVRSPDGTLAAAQDLDGDLALDWLDNCPGLANGDQQDSDVDFQGDPCDATPTHWYDFLDVRPRTRSISVYGAEFTRIRGEALVANLSPWPDAVRVEITVFGLPPGCDVQPWSVGADGSYHIRPMAETRIRWSVDVVCAPGTPKGAHSVLVEGTVVSTDGFVPFLDQATATLRLRVR
jgi:hypothetical protein